jgi:hypothetical protein
MDQLLIWKEEKKYFVKSDSGKNNSLSSFKCFSHKAFINVFIPSNLLHDAIFDWLVFDLLGIPMQDHLSDALHFFVMDIVKIFFMLALVEYPHAKNLKTMEWKSKSKMA